MKNDDKLDNNYTVELFGKIRRVRYPIKSAIQFKRITKGGSLLKAIDLGDPEVLCSFFWAGLIADDKEIDGVISDKAEVPENVQNFLNQLYELEYSKVIELFPSFMGALTQAQPKEGEKSAKAGKSKSGTS